MRETTGRGGPVGLNLLEHLPALVLLAAMLLSIAGSFIAARWTSGLEAMAWTATGGLLAGFLLARSIFHPRIAHAFSFVYGVVGTALAVSRYLPDELGLRAKVIAMALRIWHWLELVRLGQGRSTDALVFVLQMAFLGWWAAYIAAWFAFRRRQMTGIWIPSGFIIFWNLYYSPLPLTGYLLAYLLCGLLLVIHLTLRRRQARWQRQGVSFDADPGGGLLHYGLSFSLAAMILAWAIPPLTDPQADALIQWLPAERVTVRLQQEWQRLFAALEYPLRGPGEPLGMELGWPGPISADPEPVLTIQAPLRRYYWRGVAYDEYTGREWRDTDAALELLAPHTSLTPPDEYAMRQEVTQTVTTHLAGTTMLFAAAQPLHMSPPAKVYYALAGQVPLAPSLWQSHRPLRRDEAYTAVSSLSVASEEDLHAAGTAYPAWTRDRYLQLPDDLPDRVVNLAYTIAQGAPTPYDQALALERYLRTIPYNEQVGPAPVDRDNVDHFLFDGREGYCTHYASAMVVMARALGIPARLAAGYATGEYDAEQEAFLVSRADGHAWPEVFFPQYGWVEFEPTAAQPLIARPRPLVIEGVEGEPDREARALGPEDDGLPEDEFPYPRTGLALPFPGAGAWRNAARITMIVALAGFVATLGWGVGHWWIGRHFTPAAWAYARLVASGHWLSCPLAEGQTPHQYARELARAIPQARVPIQRLVDLYVAERFGHHSSTEEAERTWGDLRPLLWRSWLQQRWELSAIRSILRAWRRAFG